MRHRNKIRKLGRTAPHREAMLANMTTSLFRHEAITTTEARARALRSVADKMITLAKRGDLHARRQAASVVRDRVILKKLFDDLAPQFRDRDGGYTQTFKIGTRLGDRASMARVALILPKVQHEEPAGKGKGDKKGKSAKSAAAKTAKAIKPAKAVKKSKAKAADDSTG